MRVGRNPMTGIIRRGKFGHRVTGRMLCDDGGKDWSDAPRSKGMPRIAGNHQKLGESPGMDSQNS